MKTYEIFTGEELAISEKIQQRRYQMLIHSCIYYRLNDNVISDNQWNKWANELTSLQQQYPNISKQVPLYEYFEDWDGSTGAFLPLDLEWVNNLAYRILNIKYPKIVTVQYKKKVVDKSVGKKRLF